MTVEIHDGTQVALFVDRSGALYAVDNRDPFSGAHVLSRGLLGSREGRPTFASPMYKQTFDLTDGRCLDEDTAPDGTPAVLRRWPVRAAATDPGKPLNSRSPLNPLNPQNSRKEERA